MGYYVGIDVGGTFTDICVANQDGKVSVYKTPTLPDIGRGVIDAAGEIGGEGEQRSAARGLRIGEIVGQRFAHHIAFGDAALLDGRGQLAVELIREFQGDGFHGGIIAW